MNKDRAPIISVDFILCGENENPEFDKITCELGIVPDYAKRREERKCPQLAKHEWGLSVSRDSSYAVQDVFTELLKKIEQKEQCINRVQQELNLQAVFVVVVVIYKDRPEIVLSPQIVSFAGSIHAEISIDIYYGDE